MPKIQGEPCNNHVQFKDKASRIKRAEAAARRLRINRAEFYRRAADLLIEQVEKGKGDAIQTA